MMIKKLGNLLVNGAHDVEWLLSQVLLYLESNPEVGSKFDLALNCLQDSQL